MTSRRLRSASTLVAVALAVAVTAILAGCGASAGGKSSAGRPVQSASLILDFTPNAIHSGIYTALADHYDTDNGIDLHVVVPGESTDAIDLLTAGKVNFAILDIHDLAIADAQGRDLVGIMAIVERPLASVIAQPKFKSPRDLEGQTVGVTGDPSDLAVLHSIVAGSGGDPAKVKTLTIGYDAVPDLLNGRVAAATAFWNDEGVQLAHKRPGFHVFRVEDFGAPPYPELVVCATRQELDSHPALARDLVRTLVDGYQTVLKHPEDGIQALTSQVTGLSSTSVEQQLAAELPAFTPAGGGGVGTLPHKVLEEWARWEVRFGIVKHTPDIATMFDTSFLPK